MFANEGMGEVDDHQNFQVGGCMRIIDRERGLTFNRWIFEVFGQPRRRPDGSGEFRTAGVRHHSSQHHYGVAQHEHGSAR